MKRIFCFTILFLTLSISLFAQEEQQVGSNKITLPRLLLKNKGILTILNDIDAYIGNKPNGLHFPVTKIVFSELEDLLCYEIVGIDNSWKHLFKFGEVPYGYLIIYNRLYLVVGEGYHTIDLNPIFATSDKEKTFNRANFMPAQVFDRNPVWFFEYKNNQSYLISVSDLDVLD